MQFSKALLFSWCCLVVIVSALQSLMAYFPPELCCHSLDGRGKAFGCHKQSDGPVKEYTTILKPEVFWNDHVRVRLPCVLRDAISKSPAITLWDDKYLMQKYGENDVLVELKRENRHFSTGRMRFHAFLERYQKDNLYVVSLLPNDMMKEVQAISSVLCGTFKNYTHESNFWMSSGGTRSVIHYDADHNLHCMIAGRKDFIMVAKKYESLLYIPKKDLAAGSGFSSIDPDHVDLTKYPNVADVPWTYASLKPGDCIYIPAEYIHQVRAYGRSISATTLFTEDVTGNFTSEGCENIALDEYHSMAEIDFHWSYKEGDTTVDMGYINVEKLRDALLKHITLNMQKGQCGQLNKKIFLKSFPVLSLGQETSSASDIFNRLDKFGKGYLDIKDVMHLTRDQLKLLARAIDPPHGPKTESGTEVYIMPFKDLPPDDEHDDNEDDTEDEVTTTLKRHQPDKEMYSSKVGVKRKIRHEL